MFLSIFYNIDADRVVTTALCVCVNATQGLQQGMTSSRSTCMRMHASKVHTAQNIQ